MPRKPGNVEKSPVKSPRLRGVAADPRLRGPGRGPKKGAPNAGRPPSAIRAAMRTALDERLHILADIADDPSKTPIERMKALDMLGKYGMGTTITETDNEGKDVPRAVLMVPMAPDAGTWALATQAQQAGLEAAKRALSEQHGVG
ncbi:MAG: hypothetical protein ACK6DP_12435 [Gemmatimonas sp.]